MGNLSSFFNTSSNTQEFEVVTDVNFSEGKKKTRTISVSGGRVLTIGQESNWTTVSGGGTTISGSVPRDGLILEFTMDNIDSGYVYDSSGNNNNGINNGNIQTFNDGPLSIQPVIGLNGSDQYINTAASNASRSVETVSLWYYTNNDPLVFETLYQDSNIIIGNNAIRVWAGGAGSGQFAEYTNINIPMQVWTHLTFVMHDTRLGDLYINGAIYSMSFVTGDSANNYSASNLGATYGNGSMVDFFSGGLNNVRVYDRELTLSEIQELYQEGVS